MLDAARWDCDNQRGSNGGRVWYAIVPCLRKPVILILARKKFRPPFNVKNVALNTDFVGVKAAL